MSTDIFTPDWKRYYESEAEVQDFHPDEDKVEMHRCLAAWSVFPRPIHRDAALLDAGCGNGFFCSWIAQQTRLQKISGADLSEQRIKIARERYPNFDFRVADLQQLPWPDNTFDVVTCIEVLEHIPDPLKVLRELLRVSRRHVVITVPDRNPIRLILCPHCGKKFPMFGHIHSFDFQRLEKLVTQAGAAVEVIRPFYAARGARWGIPPVIGRIIAETLGRLTKARATFLAARIAKQGSSL